MVTRWFMIHGQCQPWNFIKTPKTAVFFGRLPMRSQIMTEENSWTMVYSSGVHIIELEQINFVQRVGKKISKICFRKWEKTNKQTDWLVVFRHPLWKIYDFVNWDDDIPFPIFLGKYNPKMATKPPTRTKNPSRMRLLTVDVSPALPPVGACMTWGCIGTACESRSEWWFGTARPGPCTNSGWMEG